MNTITVRNYAPEDKKSVIRLWGECGLVVPWNDPEKDIERKLRHSPELFFLAESGSLLAGTCMAGYDGHRGWVYYLAVNPQLQRQGIGRLLMKEAEARLEAIGCPKIDLMVRDNNETVLEFYRHIGYAADSVKVLSRRLIKEN